MKSTRTRINRLAEYMSDGKWHKATAIKEWTGIDARRIRQIAEETSTLISSNKGYKLTDMAPEGEVLRCARSLRSRARKMELRADLISMDIKLRYEK
jgi:hypothetical protein